MINRVVMEKMIYTIVFEKNNPGKLNALLSGIKTIDGERLYAVVFDEISSVVSDMNRVDLITDKSHAIAFAGVIETLEQHFALLPMRYGSMMESNLSIQKMLEKNYPEFRQNLLKVENKSEFGLKIFCDARKLKKELGIKSEKETARRPVSEIKNSVFREYVDKKLKEHRIEELLLSYVDSIIAEFTEVLARLNAVNKFKKMTTETNIIDAVFLLEKDKKGELVQTVEDLQCKHPGLNFTLTGPWPPYNFVDMTIK
jgi:hypothetical protein